LLPSQNAEGYVLIAVYLFIYLYVCYSHKSIKPNRMKFGGMIGYYPGTIWLDFGIDQVKGQGHEKVPKKWLRQRYALYRVPVLVLCMFLTYRGIHIPIPDLTDHKETRNHVGITSHVFYVRITLTHLLHSDPSPCGLKYTSFLFLTAHYWVKTVIKTDIGLTMNHQIGLLIDAYLFVLVL